MIFCKRAVCCELLLLFTVVVHLFALNYRFLIPYSKGILDLIGSLLSWVLHMGFIPTAFQLLAHILNHYIVCYSTHCDLCSTIGIWCVLHHVHKPAVLLFKSQPSKQ